MVIYASSLCTGDYVGSFSCDLQKKFHSSAKEILHGGSVVTIKPVLHYRWNFPRGATFFFILVSCFQKERPWYKEEHNSARKIPPGEKRPKKQTNTPESTASFATVYREKTVGRLHWNLYLHARRINASNYHYLSQSIAFSGKWERWTGWSQSVNSIKIRHHVQLLS